MGKGKDNYRCNKEFGECELDILRGSVDEAEKKMAERNITPEMENMIKIVEKFLKDNKLVCYGGTAINNILPLEDQFYDRTLEMPDYDFYSGNALEDAKKLSDIYVKAGYSEVEAKVSSFHAGTYKVYVNFIPVADISQMDSRLFKAILRDAIKIDNISYAPPNFLRMGMYLELSRPAGDVSRWEKVLKRLILLNKNYPLRAEDCNNQDVQRKVLQFTEDEYSRIFNITRDTFTNLGLVFLGGYANMLYSSYMPKHLRKKVRDIPDFDLLSNNPEKSCTILKERLTDAGFKNIKVNKHSGIGEIIASHYEVAVGKETVAFVYKPLACHSYNVITINNKKTRVATIDTMLSFYLAFYYGDKPYYDKDRIMCMSTALFKVQQKNRLSQRGLLNRFSIICYGRQETIDDVRAHKSEKFKELNELSSKEKEKHPDFLKYFFKYNPTDKKNKSGNKKSKKNKTKKGGTSRADTSRAGTSRAGTSKAGTSTSKVGTRRRR